MFGISQKPYFYIYYFLESTKASVKESSTAHPLTFLTSEIAGNERANHWMIHKYNE